jgi:hypothetical protein
MAEKKEFTVDCTTDAAKRPEGLALIQECWNQIAMHRKQFTTTKVVNPDGSFVLTVETNGLTVGQSKPVAKEPKTESVKTPKT